MKLATAGHLETVHIIRIFHTEADVGIQFQEETVAKMTGGYKLSFLSRKRTVIDLELHGNRRLRNLLERNRFRVVRRADRVSNGDIRNTGDSNDRTDAGFSHLYLV